MAVFVGTCGAASCTSEIKSFKSRTACRRAACRRLFSGRSGWACALAFAFGRALALPRAGIRCKYVATQSLDAWNGRANLSRRSYGVNGEEACCTLQNCIRDGIGPDVTYGLQKVSSKVGEVVPKGRSEGGTFHLDAKELL